MKKELCLTAAAVLLGTASAPAHAHGVPVWMFVAAVSPVFVLILIALFGWLVLSWRVAFIHTVLIVIWAALVLYLLHVLLLASLVIVHVFRRLKARSRAPLNADVRRP